MKDLDNWQPYEGEYPKAFLDIVLKDGTTHNQVWPNAGQFHVTARVIEGDEVAVFRKSAEQKPLTTPRRQMFGGVR